jgi:hypothetical protein
MKKNICNQHRHCLVGINQNDSVPDACSTPTLSVASLVLGEAFLVDAIQFTKVNCDY